MPNEANRSMKTCVCLQSAIMALVCLPAASCVAVQPLAAIVPSNAVAYVATSDVTTLERQWSETSFYRLWQDDQMREFKTSLRQATRLTPESDLSTFGLNWEHLRGVASGGACWSLIPLQDNESGYLLLIDVSQREEQAKSMLDELRAQSASVTNKRIYFHQKGVLGVTNHKVIAEQVMKLLKEAQPEGLASSEAFQAVESRCLEAAGNTSVQLTWFVDPWQFQALWRISRETASLETTERLQREGFDVILAAGGVLSFSTKENDVEHHWFALAPGTRAKAARMLNFSPLGNPKLPAWLPADIDTLRCVGWNLSQALAGYGSWFDDTWAEGEEGTFEAVLDDIRLEPDGPQVDIRALLKLQAGPVLSVSKSVDAEGRRDTENIYALKLHDKAKAKEEVRRMFHTDKGVDLKLVEEHEMWVFVDRVQDGEAAALGPDLTGVAVCVADGYLFVSTSDVCLEQLLQKPAATLPNDPTFRVIDAQLNAKQTDKCIGRRVSLLAAGVTPTYADLRSQGSVAVDELFGDDSLKTSKKDTSSNDDSTKRSVDFSKLPAAKILQNYLPAGYGLVSETTDGWLFSGYVMKSSE